MTFEDVIKHLDKKGRNRHLLLGNGFSMAYDPTIFSYNALSKFVDDSENELLLKLFKTVKTRNFEEIMKQLALCKEIIRNLSGENELITKIDQATELLKTSLIDAIKTLHPEHVFSIPESKCTACANFIKGFLNNNGEIFSTNYDILLYWVLMRNKIPNAIDGFGRDRLEQEDWVPEEDLQFSELRWGKHKGTQNIFYLHGALPIFDVGIEVIKEEYDGNYILENIRKRMDRGHYPVFVTGGDAYDKLIHIRHNSYLSYCYDSLCSINGSLITFGFNFGEFDDHIIKAINKAANQDITKKLWSVYVGVYSDKDISRFEELRGKFKCQQLHLFDSKTVKVWE